jgi:O-methyltransferase involved in polyketide biosynthesis
VPRFKRLREVASLAPGSPIVFTYHVPEDTLDARDRQVLHVLRGRAAAGGAPWLTSFDWVVVAERLRASGCAEVVDFGPEQAQARYFGGRTDGLSAHGTLLRGLTVGEVAG